MLGTGRTEPTEQEHLRQTSTARQEQRQTLYAICLFELLCWWLISQLE